MTKRKPPAAAPPPAAPLAPRRNPPRQVISAEQYNALWLTWLETQRVEECARRAGVDRKTARRYISGPGCPEKGMEPILVRHERVLRQAKEDEDMVLLKWRQESFSQVIAKTMQLLKGEAILHQRDLNKRLEASKQGADAGPSLPLDRLVGAMDRTYRMGEHALGGPDATIEQTRGDRFTHWSEEELLEFWETGRRPVHDL